MCLDLLIMRLYIHNCAQFAVGVLCSSLRVFTWLSASKRDVYITISDDDDDDDDEDDDDDDDDDDDILYQTATFSR